MNAAEFEPGAATANPHDRRRVTSSERMRRTHEAAAYDQWFRQQARATAAPGARTADPPKAARKPARKAEH